MFLDKNGLGLEKNSQAGSPFILISFKEQVKTLSFDLMTYPTFPICVVQLIMYFEL